MQTVQPFLFAILLLPNAIATTTIKPIQTTSLNEWGHDTQKVFNFFTFSPQVVQEVLRKVPNNELLIRARLLPKFKKMYAASVNKTIHHEVIALYRKNGANTLANLIVEATTKCRAIANQYSNITRDNLYNFFEEMSAATFLNDEYHISFILLRYLHMRNGFGMARKVLREMFPMCEKFIKVQEIHEFYRTHKRENPRLRRVIKKFWDLIEWLNFKNKLNFLK